MSSTNSRHQVQTGYLLLALNGVEIKDLNPDSFEPHGYHHVFGTAVIAENDDTRLASCSEAGSENSACAHGPKSMFGAHL